MRAPRRLKSVASERGLAAILWENDDPKRVRLAALVEDKNHPVLRETERQLNDYFAGKLKKFSLKFDFAGTDFQREVWRALAAIPFGETPSYREIARHYRPSRGSARRASSHRAESCLHHHPVPSGDRVQRQTNRICRRPGNQSILAQTLISSHATAPCRHAQSAAGVEIEAMNAKLEAFREGQSASVEERSD
jgi:hypothetical protein